jgi:hypothetical protein
MKEFILLFRMNITNKELQPTKKQMESYMHNWMAWLSDIDKNKQLADGGNHFSRQGRVLRPGKIVTESPFISDDTSVAGYIIILAEHLDKATMIAQKCPILNGENTSVEIRETASPGQ